MVKNLILVLGDQLSHGLASLREGDPDTDIVVMGELMDEASYVNHHRKKLVFIFSAMRHFAKELEQEGWTVDYRRLDGKGSNKPTSFTDLISVAIKKHKPERLLLVEPGEWRVLQEVEAWEEQLGIDVDLIEDDRFIASRDEFSQWAEGKKALRMEFFYREMRRKTNLLMDGNDPVGGKWNYDAENRKSPPKDLETPPPFEIEPDEITKDVIAMVQSKFPDGFGTIDPFWFAVTHDDAQKCVDRFVDGCLPIFGDYQDAMIADNRFMAHSLLSFYINAGLLDPLDVCIQVEKAY
ncbi:MAG: cryptochrome/photolyase family protein, partial [Pseudomonadota bacterium]